MVRIVGSVGLDVSQDAGQAEGVTALADACADKVVETDWTNDVVAIRDALLDHPNGFPADAFVGAVKRIIVGIRLGMGTPRQEEAVCGGRVQIKHGRVCFLADRCPVQCASSAVVLVVVPSIVAAAVPRIIICGEGSVMAGGSWGRKMKIHELVCVLLASIFILLTLALFRVAPHCDFEKLLL